jgi:hypothetical protein
VLHEVVERRGVVRQVDPVDVARVEALQEHLDAVLVRVEVRDVEPVEPEDRPGVGDLAQVVHVVGVARVRDDDLRRVDASLGELLQRERARLRLGVGVHHDRHAGGDRRQRGRVEDERDVADDPVALDGALQERCLHARVVDPDLDLPPEDRREILRRAVLQVAGDLDERVQAGADDDVDVDLGVDALQPVDVAAQPEARRIDDRLHAEVAQLLQIGDRCRDALLLVPPGRAPVVVEVRDPLGARDEDVLVEERGPQVL